VLDAWRLEEAWRKLPELFRLLLLYYYHRNWHPGHVCRKVKQHPARFNDLLRKSRAALRNVLKRAGQML
jgi:DNA-directed RNA polymerase specialized sigma24 family protein